MARVGCDGVEINYRSIGSGEDVILIHGLAASQAFWHPLVVQGLAEQHQVTVYDLRGHGYSSMPCTGYTSAVMAEDLHHLLDHLDIESAHVVGHSFGGLIALHYAILHPERTQSLTLADVRVRALQPTQSSRDWPSREGTKKMLEKCGLVVPDDVQEAGLWMLEKLASPEWQQAREALRAKITSFPWGTSKRSASQWLKILQNTTAREDILLMVGLTEESLTTITHPSLGIYGEHSPAQQSLEGLQRLLPNFQTSIIAGGGHFFPMSRPKLFVERVKAFLKDVESKE